MSKPLLSIFADGIRYDSIQYMPFLKSLNYVPLETILGYSITCHPSMYTGVYPNKHKIVFHWIKCAKKFGYYSPFILFPNIFPFSNPYVEAMFSHIYSKTILKNKSKPFMGYGKILNMPMKFWNKLDINEKKYWDEDGYIDENIKTIFELAKYNKIKHYISNIHKPNLGCLDAIIPANPSDYDWVYYFIGESDNISHQYCQHSNEGINFLQKIDDFIKDQYLLFEKTYGKEGFSFIFWSDHGHIPINVKYNLIEEFKKNKININNFFHIIDSTTVRFWIKNEKQKSNIENVMCKIPHSHLVSRDMFNDLHLPKDVNLYGDLFYYLDGGCVFTHTIHGFGLDTCSMHGYHPKEYGNEGLLASNCTILSKRATLPDVFVSSINKLNFYYKPKVELDGRNILS